MSHTFRAALVLCALTTGCGSSMLFPGATTITVTTRSTAYVISAPPETMYAPPVQVDQPPRVVYQPVAVAPVQQPVRYIAQPAMTPPPPVQNGYQTGSVIQVRFSGMSGSQTDWVTLVPEGAPHTQYNEWMYTQGQRDGVYSFHAPAPGRYVARAYFNWPAGDYQLRAESQTIVVY